MRLIPYLSFDGRCAEAFHHYAEVLRGEVKGIVTHGDVPGADQFPPELHPRVMNAYLVAGDLELMGADVPPGTEHRPQGFSLSLHPDSREDAERLWAALLDGGEVVMPMETTFWAERFGMLTDRFGTPWMVNFEGSVHYRPAESSGETAPAEA
jgi:PhnB protein